MTGTLHRLGFCVALVLAVCAPGHAKCPLIFLDLEGEVLGAVSKGDRIVTDVSPDPNTSPADIHVEERTFTARIAFDTTRSVGRFHHDCSRRPKTVTLRLLSAEEELDRATLSFEHDFTEVDDGFYRPTSSLELHEERAPARSCVAPDGRHVARIDERNRRLFVVATAGELKEPEEAAALLGRLARHVASCHPGWRDRWRITFVAEPRFAGYKDEPEILPRVEDGSWYQGYLAEYSRRRSLLVLFPLLPDRRVEREMSVGRR